jgi:hypothetical protein
VSRSFDVRALREIASWWLVSRVAVFGTALLVGAIGWPRDVPEHGLALLTGWDGAWYRGIAAHGYDAGTRDVSFFPLLPLILAALAVIGVPMKVTGLVVANVACAAAIAGIYALCRTWLPEPDARRAAVYAAVFPMSFVFSMAYPESIAVAASVAAALAAYSGRWEGTAAFGTVAALARPQAALIALPLLAIAWRERPASIAASAAPLAAVGGFWIYLWQSLGDPNAWSQAEGRGGEVFIWALRSTPPAKSCTRRTRCSPTRHLRSSGFFGTSHSRASTSRCSWSRSATASLASGSPTARCWSRCRWQAARSPRWRGTGCSPSPRSPASRRWAAAARATSSSGS